MSELHHNNQASTQETPSNPDLYEEALKSNLDKQMNEYRRTVDFLADAPDAVVFGYTLAANKHLAQQVQDYDHLQSGPEQNPQLAIEAAPSDKLGKEVVLYEQPADSTPESATNDGSETDAYGNPVNHQFEWARPSDQKALPPAPEKSKELVPIEKSKELVPAEETLEPSSELIQQFEAARDKYAELTVRDRRGSFLVGRYLKDPRSVTGKILHKIPGVKQLSDKVVDKMNDNRGQQITEARNEYHNLVKQLEDFAEKSMLEQKKSEQEALVSRALMSLYLDNTFEDKVLEMRQEKEKTNGLVNWWVNADSKKAKVLKVASLAAAGAVVGSAAALVLPTMGAAAAVTAAGMAGANYFNKKRGAASIDATDREGNAVVDAENNPVKRTIAEQQAAHDKEAKTKRVNEYIDVVNQGQTDAKFGVDRLTEITENRSNEQSFENRSRMRKTAAAANLGFLGTRAVSMGIDMITGDAPAPETTAEPAAEQPPATPPTPEAPTFNGEIFTVEHGNGYTHELREFMSANGHNLSAQQSFDLHNAIMERFGSDYIQHMDTYTQAGDVRLSNPMQTARWAEGVPEFIDKWRVAHGIQ